MTRKVSVTGSFYDPREGRVRRMVLDPATWPGGVLHMKRIVDDRIVEFGVIDGPMTDVGPAIFINAGDTVYSFPTLDALIASSWRVD